MTFARPSDSRSSQSSTPSPRKRWPMERTGRARGRWPASRWGLSCPRARSEVTRSIRASRWAKRKEILALRARVEIDEHDRGRSSRLDRDDPLEFLAAHLELDPLGA